MNEIDAPEYLPTAEQLATLAAMLARTSDEPPDSLAKRALRLWRASVWELAVTSDDRLAEYVTRLTQASMRGIALSNGHIMRVQKRSPELDDLKNLPSKKANAALNNIRPPRKFPVAPDHFAGLVVPRLAGRTGDAGEAIRGWLAWRERVLRYSKTKRRADLQAQLSKDEVDQLVRAWRNREIDEREFSSQAPTFALWHARDHARKVAEVRSQVGRLGGKTRSKRAAAQADSTQPKRTRKKSLQ